MKRLAAVAMAVGAVLALTTPADAAGTSTLSLWTNRQPATVKVNGRDVVVNNGHIPTSVQVPTGNVHLVAQYEVRLGPGNCARFSTWHDGNMSPARTVDVSGHRSMVALYGFPC